MHADELADKEQETEPRSKPQERADVLISIIAGTGKQDAAPTLHSRGPTVLLTVNDTDLKNQSGAAWTPGTRNSFSPRSSVWP